MDATKYLIQGIIFQDRQDFRTEGTEGISIDTYNGSGIIKALFHGVIAYTPTGGVRGEFNDHWGKSKIYGFALIGSSMGFYKSYEGRPPIEYTFKKQPDGVWHGIYKSQEEKISGTAKCYLLPIDDSFFVANV